MLVCSFNLTVAIVSLTAIKRLWVVFYIR